MNIDALDCPVHGTMDMSALLAAVPDGGLPALAVRLMVHGLIVVGLWHGLERTDLTAGQRRTSRPIGIGPSTTQRSIPFTTIPATGSAAAARSSRRLQALSLQKPDGILN
jgi:hypothetical protein